MKTKAFIVYIALGVAFAAVSLWVLLCRGKNARAIRTKYRLGGAMIAAWAMLSAASCNGPGLFVTCYDAASPLNMVYITPKDTEDPALNSGDILLIQISDPTYDKFTVRLYTIDDQPQLLQSESFDFADKSQDVATFELQIADNGYKGVAILKVFGVATENDVETETYIGGDAITII